MNFFEALFFILITITWLGVGRLISHKWHTAGLLIGIVPVGLFWTAIVILNIVGVLKRARESWRNRGNSG